MSRRDDADWEAIEREYRVGQLSVREIARQHGVAESAIRGRATRKGWKRDLREDVRNRVYAEVDRDDARAHVRTPDGGELSDDQVVEHAADRGKAIIHSHRHDLSEARSMVNMLMAELRATTDGVEVLREVAEQRADDFTNQQTREKALNAVHKALSLPGRAATMRSLAQSLRSLIPLERQAFSLDEGQGPSDPLRELLDQLGATPKNSPMARVADKAAKDEDDDED